VGARGPRIRASSTWSSKVEGKKKESVKTSSRRNIDSSSVSETLSSKKSADLVVGWPGVVGSADEGEKGGGEKALASYDV